MKRPAFLLMGLLAILAFQIINSCSQPLDSSDLTGGVSPTPGGGGDTLYVVDTVYIVHGGKVDTVIVVDTIIQVDTVTVADTTIVDTVIVIEPGSGDSKMLCAHLSTAQQEIVWLFRNSEGPYHLEFAALPERDHPTHVLSVTVDDQAYEWPLTEGLELILDQTLSSNAVLRIATSKPPSFGHAIDICLTITRP